MSESSIQKCMLVSCNEKRTVGKNGVKARMCEVHLEQHRQRCKRSIESKKSRIHQLETTTRDLRMHAEELRRELQAYKAVMEHICQRDSQLQDVIRSSLQIILSDHLTLPLPSLHVASSFSSKSASHKEPLLTLDAGEEKKMSFTSTHSSEEEEEE